MGIKYRNLDETLKNMLSAAGLLSVGEIFHLTDSNDGQFYTWLGQRVSGDRLYTSIASAEDAMTANRNDTMIVHPDSHTLPAAGLTWDKNYTNIIGAGAPSRVANRSRMFAAAAGTVGSINISATGCNFINWYVFNGSSSDTDLYNVTVSGGRNYFKEIHFAGLGHATQAGRAGASNLFLNGGDENLFVDCTVGIDTITRTADAPILRVDGGATRNKFENCLFQSASETATHSIVKVIDSTSIDRWLWFHDCTFTNFSVNKAANLNQAIDDITGQTHTIMITGNSSIFGIDSWQDDDTGNVFGTMPVANAAGGNAIEISE